MWVWPLIVGKSVALEMIWDTFGHRSGSWEKTQTVDMDDDFFKAIWKNNKADVIYRKHKHPSNSVYQYLYQYIIKFTRIGVLLEWIYPLLYGLDGSSTVQNIMTSRQLQRPNFAQCRFRWSLPCNVHAASYEDRWGEHRGLKGAFGWCKTRLAFGSSHCGGFGIS